MAHKTDNACADREQLRDLLADRLADDVQSRLTAHLDGCDACRDQLERLAAESQWWNEARELGDSSSDRATHAETAAYTPSGRDGGNRATGQDRRSALDDPTAALPFLEPPDDRGFLGTFGAYQVIDVVGRGGMGVLLKAFDPSLHRVVAVKVMAPQLAAGNAARQRFIREARAAASVCHENVVTIHSVDEYRGWPHLVMQYVGGKSLQDRIDHTGTLEIKEILRIGMQTAAGLSAAHAQGLVHRDIKPANILLENGIERVKITDFGLARAVDDPSLTQAGVVAGTPQYMSPEQARCEPVDERSDLFSLGAVMYAMATGRPPFRGDTTIGVLRRVCDENPRPIRDSNPDVPAWLEAIIIKLLSKNPAHRYRSASEVSVLLADRLAELQQGKRIAAGDFDLPAEVAHPKAPPSSMPVPALVDDVGPEKRARATPRWRWAAGLAALGLLGLGVTDAAGVTKIHQALMTILRIETRDGTLVVELDDPEVQVTLDDDEVAFEGGGMKQLRVKPGVHTLRTFGEGWTGPTRIVTVQRGGRETIRVGIEPRLPPDHAAHLEFNRPEIAATLRTRFEAAGSRRIALENAQEALKAEVEAREGAVEEADIALDYARRAFDTSTKRFENGFESAGEHNTAEASVNQADGAARIARAEADIARARLDVATATTNAADAQQAILGLQIRQEGAGDTLDSSARKRFEEATQQLRAAIVQLGDARVHLANEVVWLRSKEVESTERTLAITQAAYERGSIPRTEVDQSQALLAQAGARLRAAKAALERADLREKPNGDRQRAIEESVKAAVEGSVDMILPEINEDAVHIVPWLVHTEESAKGALKRRAEHLREAIERIRSTSRGPENESALRALRRQLKEVEQAIKQRQAANEPLETRQQMIIETVPTSPDIAPPEPPLPPEMPEESTPPVPPLPPTAPPPGFDLRELGGDLGHREGTGGGSRLKCHPSDLLKG